MMSVVKRMTATEDFLKMSLKERNCEVELYEDCRTRRLFEHCNCVPWEMSLLQVQNGLNKSFNFRFFHQDTEICDPKGRDCIEKNSAETFNCSTTCVGIYADVQWVGNNIEEETDEDFKEDIGSDMRAKDRDYVLEKMQRRLAELERKMKKVFEEGAVGEKGQEMDKEKYKCMIAEYRKFKSKNVKHFRFSSARNSSAFGELFLLF